MLQIIIKKIADYCMAKNRWWIPLLTGFSYALCLPPFNHEYNPLFAPFPLLSFFILVPLMFFSMLKPLKKAVLFTFLYSFSAALVQFYWIGFVTAEGLWHLILLGLVLISAGMGAVFLVAGMFFRIATRISGRYYIIIFPAIWICIDFVRSIGDIAFPWSFLGYSLTPFLSVAQFATVTGVWGVTYIIVLGNILIWEILLSYYHNENQAQKVIHAVIFILMVSGISVWGFLKLKSPLHSDRSHIALVQSNIDQFHWGNNSLESAFNITENMIQTAALNKPELIIGPESALLCYLERRPDLSNRVKSWADATETPLLLGALHWDKAQPSTPNEYFVYNSAFLIEPHSNGFVHYNKQKLVPFSEKMPFENFIPILSRVNLGEADFRSGVDSILLTPGNKIKAAPFICYEIIFPSFVQQRLQKGANLVVTITNDGWFGRTSAPYQHAMMARMRAIENRISIVRCANSGISMFIDPFGRVLKKTDLYTRAVIDGDIQLKTADTFYSKHGDWFVSFCLLLSTVGLGLSSALIIFGKKKVADHSNVN